jgi:hypothetical protein
MTGPTRCHVQEKLNTSARPRRQPATLVGAQSSGILSIAPFTLASKLERPGCVIANQGVSDTGFEDILVLHRGAHASADLP